MRICYLSFDGMPTLAATDSQTGGLNVTLFNISKEMACYGINATVIWRDDGKSDKYINELQRLGVEIVKIKAGKNAFLTKVELVKTLSEFTDNVDKYLSGNKFDIVQTLGSEAGYVISVLKKTEIISSAVWVHENFASLGIRRVVVEKMSLEEALEDSIGQREKGVLEKCDHIVAYTSIEKEEIERIFGIKSDKISVISAGIDKNIFRPPEYSSERPPIVISATRMAKIKNIPFLLNVLKRVAENNKDIKSLLFIVIGGNKNERDKLDLENMVKTLNLENFISFVDGVSQEVLAKYFQFSRVFVGTSDHETFGLLPVEARSCGTPFVVRANSSYLATAKNGEGGYFVDSHNEEEMARKIGEIIRLSLDKWQKLSQLAVKSTDNFSWRKSAMEYLSLYQFLLKRREIKL